MSASAQNLRGEDVSDEMFAFEQRKREVHLAVLLQQRLQPYVVCQLEGDLTEAQRHERLANWEAEMRREAQTLCGVSPSLAGTLLRTRQHFLCVAAERAATCQHLQPTGSVCEALCSCAVFLRRRDYRGRVVDLRKLRLSVSWEA